MQSWFWVFIGTAAAVATVLVVFRARVKSGLSRLRRSVGSVFYRGGKGAKERSPKEPPNIPKGPKPLG